MSGYTRPTQGPYAVVCKEHGQVILTDNEYERQMARPNNGWFCPLCQDLAYWDDDNFQREMAEEDS